MNTKRKIKSTQIVTICPIPIPLPLPPNKKLIGFGSLEKVNLKLAGGGPDPWTPPASYAPAFETDSHSKTAGNDR